MIGVDLRWGGFTVHAPKAIYMLVQPSIRWFCGYHTNLCNTMDILRLGARVFILCCQRFTIYMMQEPHFIPHMALFQVHRVS